MDSDGGAENRGGGPGAISAAPLDRGSANDRAETVTDADKTDPTTETAAEIFKKMLDPVEGVAKFEIFTAGGQRIASGSAYPGELRLTNFLSRTDRAESGVAFFRGKPGKQLQAITTPSFVQHILKCSVANGLAEKLDKMACRLAEKVEDKFNLPRGTFIASAGRQLRDKSSAPHEYPLFPPDEATRVVHSSMGTGSNKVEQLLYFGAHYRYCSHAMLFTLCFATRRKMLVPVPSGHPNFETGLKYEHCNCSLGFQVCPLTGRISMPGIFVAATETQSQRAFVAGANCCGSYENLQNCIVYSFKMGLWDDWFPWRCLLVDKEMRVKDFDDSEQSLQQHRSELGLLAKILQHPDTPTLVCDALGSDLREDLGCFRNVMREHSQPEAAAGTTGGDGDQNAAEEDEVEEYMTRTVRNTRNVLSVAEYLEGLYEDDRDGKKSEPLTCCEGHPAFVGHFYWDRRLTFDRAAFVTLFAEDGDETESTLLELNCGVATWGQLLKAVYRHRVQNQEPLSDPIQFTLVERNTNAAAASASGAEL